MTRKRYIFYMHPAQQTPLCNIMTEFWNASRRVCDHSRICGDHNQVLNHNEALRYPFHVTLTRFFSVDSDQLGEIVRIAQDAFKNVQDQPVVMNRIHRYQKTAKSAKKSKKRSDKKRSEKSKKSEKKRSDRKLGGRVNSCSMKIAAPSVSTAVQELVNNTKQFKIESTTADSLHMTLYHNVTPQIENALIHAEGGLFTTIQSINWTGVTISLWEASHDLTSWRILHTFETQ